MSVSNPRNAAAMIVHMEAESRFGVKPIEEVIDPLMDHCHDHWMGAQMFYGIEEEFTLFVTTIRMLYRKDPDITLKLEEEYSVMQMLSALFSGIPVAPDALEDAEKKNHYNLMGKWREKFQKK